MRPPHQVRAVEADQWGIVAWLWQDFRHDLGAVVNGYPHGDGRYQHGWLDEYPRTDGAGYLAWAPHPHTGEDSPVGFALVTGVGSGRCGMRAFFVVPAARRGGLGRRFAGEVIARHEEPWEIAFQRDNIAAGAFWRVVATDAFGDAWTETAEPVAGRSDVPPDHWIRSTSVERATPGR